MEHLPTSQEDRKASCSDLEQLSLWIVDTQSKTHNYLEIRPVFGQYSYLSNTINNGQLSNYNWPIRCTYPLVDAVTRATFPANFPTDDMV